MRIANLAKWAIALGLLGLSFLNASWIAPSPKGGLQLVAAHSEDKARCATLEGVRRALIDAGSGVMLDADASGPCLSAKTALDQFPRYHFILKVEDAAKVMAIFETLKRPMDERYGFVGDAQAVAAIRAKAPDAWAWTIRGARTCFNDYVKLGWFGLTPETCKGGTILVPLDEKWKVAGWPKRFLARMAAANTRVILTGPGSPTDNIPGLTRLEQIPDVPRDFAGMLWLENAALIGPSIRR